MQIACHIHDDAAFRNVQLALAHAGFGCDRFVSEIMLLRTLRRQKFDLILIDATADSFDENGIYSWLNCRTGESTPVVLLASACNDGEMVLALNAGADDLIPQSCEPVLLVARLRAILRRYHGTGSRRMLDVSGFSLDLEAGRLLDRGIAVDLTQREFKMAWLLFSSLGTYLSRETISVAIWGVDSDIASRTIEQHVYKLRKKLHFGEQRGLRIRTAYTRGYRLELCDGAMPDGQEQGAKPAVVSDKAADQRHASGVMQPA